MKIKIKVTQEILEASKMCGVEEDLPQASNHYTMQEHYKPISQSCAIALAIREIAPNAEVGDATIVWGWSPPDWSILDESTEGSLRINRSLQINETWLPEEAALFINEFDGNTPEERVKMRHIEFEVDFPDALVAKIGIDQVHKVLSSSSTLESVQS